MVAEVRRRCEGLALDLVRSLGQDGNVHVGVGLGGAPIVVESRVRRQRKRGVGVRRRDVGRRQARSGRRADRLGRWHHVLRVHVRLGSRVVLVLSSPRVGVAVDSRVTGQLVRAGELLAAARELASVRLLARVGANVSRLMLEAVESLVAERALVGTGQLARRLR